MLGRKQEFPNLLIFNSLQQYHYLTPIFGRATELIPNYLHVLMSGVLVEIWAV